MSAKNMDSQGRWRNKTVAFRVSPEEDERVFHDEIDESIKIEDK